MFKKAARHFSDVFLRENRANIEREMAKLKLPPTAQGDQLVTLLAGIRSYNGAEPKAERLIPVDPETGDVDRSVYQLLAKLVSPRCHHGRTLQAVHATNLKVNEYDQLHRGENTEAYVLVTCTDGKTRKLEKTRGLNLYRYRELIEVLGNFADLLHAAGSDPETAKDFKGFTSLQPYIMTNGVKARVRPLPVGMRSQDMVRLADLGDIEI
jgi:hypothetical protein